MGEYDESIAYTLKRLADSQAAIAKSLESVSESLSKIASCVEGGMFDIRSYEQ